MVAAVRARRSLVGVRVLRELVRRAERAGVVTDTKAGETARAILHRRLDGAEIPAHVIDMIVDDLRPLLKTPTTPRSTRPTAQRTPKPKTTPIPAAALKAAVSWNEACIAAWMRRGVTITPRRYPSGSATTESADRIWGDAWIIDPTTMRAAIERDDAVIR